MENKPKFHSKLLQEQIEKTSTILEENLEELNNINEDIRNLESFLREKVAPRARVSCFKNDTGEFYLAWDKWHKEMRILVIQAHWSLTHPRNEYERSLSELKCAARKQFYEYLPLLLVEMEKVNKRKEVMPTTVKKKSLIEEMGE